MHKCSDYDLKDCTSTSNQGAPESQSSHSRKPGRAQACVTHFVGGSEYRPSSLFLIVSLPLSLPPAQCTRRACWSRAFDFANDTIALCSPLPATECSDSSLAEKRVQFPPASRSRPFHCTEPCSLGTAGPFVPSCDLIALASPKRRNSQRRHPNVF